MKRKYKELSSEEFKSARNPENFNLNVLLKSPTLYRICGSKIKIITNKDFKVKKLYNQFYLVKSGVGYSICSLYVDRHNAIKNILKKLKSNKRAWSHNLKLYVKGLEQVTSQIKFFEILLKMGA